MTRKQQTRRPPGWRGTLTLQLAILLVGPGSARAVSNAIPLRPSDTQIFRANQATVDRPFAAPVDFVKLGLEPTGRTFATTTPADKVVTVVFTPRNGSPHVVVLAPHCPVATCPGVSTTCVTANPGDVEVLDAQHLRFRFPDTHGLVGDGSDGNLTLTGPATIAVTQADHAIP